MGADPCRDMGEDDEVIRDDDDEVGCGAIDNPRNGADLGLVNVSQRKDTWRAGQPGMSGGKARVLQRAPRSW